MRPSPRGGAIDRRARRRRRRGRGGSARRVSAGPCSSLEQREPHVRLRPAGEVGLDHGGAAVARQQQPAARAAGEVHGQRGGGAHGGVERVRRSRRRAGRARRAAASRPRRSACAPSSPPPARDARPVDARGGRALDVLAQAVELGLGGRGQQRARVRAACPRRRPSRRRTGVHAREHQHLVGVRRASTRVSASPSGSRSTSDGGASTRRPRRPKVTSMRSARARAGPRVSATGSRAAAARRCSPGGSGQRPATASMRTASGSLLDHACARRASRCTRRAPARRAEIQASRPAPSSSSAEPVT